MGRLASYQKEFISFLIASEALQFGSFVTKSGRETPYFINTGKFNTGERIAKLGSFYASHITTVLKTHPTVIFGPAYKGIPLAVATAEALQRDHDIECYYSFDRKEEKDHGDKGSYVGKTPSAGDRVLIVEDVVTAGTTLRKVVPMLSSIPKVTLSGVVIAVDRCEVGSASQSAVAEAKRTLGIAVFPLLTIHQIIEHLSSSEAGKNKLSSQTLQNIKNYLAVYGAQEQ